MGNNNLIKLLTGDYIIITDCSMAGGKFMNCLIGYLIFA